MCRVLPKSNNTAGVAGSGFYDTISNRLTTLVLKARIVPKRALQNGGNSSNFSLIEACSVVVVASVNIVSIHILASSLDFRSSFVAATI